MVGCGTSSKNSDSEKGNPVELTWYTIGDEPKDLAMVQDEANKYLVDKINAKINMKFIGYGDYTQKMSVIINSGENYDLAFTCSWAGDYLGNARKGAFLELDPYFEKSAKSMHEIIDQRFWDGAKIDGKTYAVPNQKEISTAPMWAFTKEYVEKYNIPYKDIHTLEDLEPWLKIIKEKEPDIVPLYVTKGFSAPQYFDQLVAPLGIEYGDNSLTIKNMFETNKMKDTLKTLRRYYELGYINSDSATAQDNKAIKRFVTKGDGQPYAEVLWSKDLKYDVVSSQIMDPYVTNASTTGSMMAVSKNSKNPDKAVEFLNLLNTDEHLRNLLNYGIEGTHYEKVGEKQIKLTGKAEDYKVGYYTLGNLFLTYTLNNEPETKWDEFRTFNKKAQDSSALGFKFDTSNVTTQIAAINNVLEEFKAALYSGSVDPNEYLDKLNSKLKEQGIDDVKAEMQKQIDEWSKSKK
jgi:putative aldouronate transport system substrate-binding protein